MDDTGVLCVIPARYGSTRLPVKPLVEIAGVPLVCWVYRAAERSGAFAEVLVATDDARIRQAVERHGGRAAMTSPDHLRGTDRVWEAARSRPQRYVVNLQGDEPEVPGALLNAFVAELRSRVDGRGMLTCVSRAPRAQIDNPNVVKVVLNGRDEALYFSRAPIPHDAAGGSLTFVKHTGIYGFTRESLERFCSSPPGVLEQIEKLEQLRALENGMTVHCLFHEHETSGIDTPEDLEAFRRRAAERGMRP
jgi:3-deoxy-D-manno-octulosonate cytidylyltransferase